MSNTDDVPTQPIIEATNPTPLSMAAVTIESRMAAVEAQLRDLATQRPTILAELRAEMASIRADYQLALKTGLAEEAKKREELEKRMQSALDALSVQMNEQTSMLKNIVTDLGKVVASVSGILGNPRVRTLAYTLLVSLTTIAAAIAAWCATRFPPTPAPMQAPAPTVTVIVPKDHQ